MTHKEFEELYRRHLVGVTHYVRRILGASTFADDVVADAFIKAWTRIDQYDACRGKFSTWLYKIAFNDALQHKQKFKNLHVDIGDRDFGEIVDDVDPMADKSMSDVVSLIKTIDHPNIATALSLFMIECKTYQEIADAMGVSLGTIKTWMFRGKKKLGIQKYGYQNRSAVTTSNPVREVIQPYLYRVRNKFNVYKNVKGRAVFLRSFDNVDDAKEFQKNEKKLCGK